MYMYFASIAHDHHLKTYSFIVAMTQNCYFKQFKAI